jgi:hypothetical protein
VSMQRKHKPKNVKAEFHAWSKTQAKLTLEEENDERDAGTWPSAMRHRARDHKMRTSGSVQMETFLESITHLPRLPKDVVESILRPMVCGAEDAVYLVGGIDEDPALKADRENSAFLVSKRMCRLQGGVLTELAPLPSPRCAAGAAHYQGEIIVLGGFDGPHASWWHSPSLLQAHCRAPL